LIIGKDFIVYNLPNLLTLSRIAVIPLVFLAVYFHGAYNYFAGVLFIVASITDYFDGKLARDRGEVSAFGRLLDPIADKLLVASALVVVLAQPDLVYKISYIPVFVILCRELLVSGLREFLREVNVGLPVTRLAKWKTGFQMTALSMLFFDGLFIWGGLGELLLWIAGGLTFYTGYQYFAKSLEYIKQEEASKNKTVENNEPIKKEATKKASTKKNTKTNK
jgi:cardiolipin synthase